MQLISAIFSYHILCEQMVNWNLLYRNFIYTIKVTMWVHIAAVRQSILSHLCRKLLFKYFTM